MTPDETNASQSPENRKPVGNLTDFIENTGDEKGIDVEVAVQNDGKIVVFHNRRFTTPIGWFEFDLENNQLDFVMGDGELRSFGLPMPPQITKNMQNAHQILTILMDDESGEAIEGNYIPLIIHRI